MNERQREAVRFLKMIPKSDLYEAAAAGNSRVGSGVYYISYSGGKGPMLSQAEVNELLAKGMIKLKWADAPEAHCYVLC